MPLSATCLCPLWRCQSHILCPVDLVAGLLQVFDFPSVAALATFIGGKMPVASARTTASRPALISAPVGPVKHLAPAVTAPGSYTIAVTGMAYRLPGAQHSSQGLQTADSITRIPYNRWDVVHASQQVSELQAAFGSFVSDAASFDAAAFGLSEAEALLMDPQQRLLMQVSWESLGPALSAASAESSNGAAAYRAGAGVFVGVSSRDYFTIGKEYSQVRWLPQVDTDSWC